MPFRALGGAGIWENPFRLRHLEGALALADEIEISAVG
jgi:hypothetical protein